MAANPPGIRGTSHSAAAIEKIDWDEDHSCSGIRLKEADTLSLCISPPPASPTHGGMKRLPGNATADSLTCYVREADANSLNSLEQSAPFSRSNYSKFNPISTLFPSRARLQSCRKRHKSNVGFRSPCGGASPPHLHVCPPVDARRARLLFI